MPEIKVIEVIEPTISVKLTNGVKGDQGKSIVSASFVGNDIVFVNDENEEIVIEGGKTALQGSSAYQVWVEQGNEGTVEDYLASLIGPQGNPGYTPVKGIDYFDGDDGLSAYQVWLNAGNVGTEAQFLASLKGVPGEVTTAAMNAGLAEKVNRIDGEIRGGYTPSVTYQHIRGNSEMVGNSTYAQPIVGFSEKMEVDTILNRIEAPVYQAFIDRVLNYKIYVRDTDAVFTPSSVTPVAFGDLTALETNHLSSINQIIKLNSPVYVPKNKYIFILFMAPVGSATIKRWTSDSIEAPFRHGILYGLTASWETQLYRGSSAYMQPSIKLGFEITSSMLRDYNVYREDNMTLPPKIYAVVGKTVNIYFDNLVCGNKEDYLIDAVSSKGIHRELRWEYTPTISETFTLTINLYDKNYNLINTASTTVTAVAASANTGVNKKCLFIGDSITAAGIYTGELLNLLSSDPMDITLLGSQGIAPNLHEGYSGKSVEWLYSAVNSPFVFSGVFNFTQYMSNKGYSSVDLVAIHLGINDVFSSTTDQIVDYILGENITKLNNIINNIKAFNSTIKISLMLPIMPSKSQDAFGENYASSQTKWRYKRNIHRYSKGLLSAFGSSEVNGVYILPTNVNLDTVNNMPTSTVAINSRNSTTYAMQSNGVHPANSGYYQIADSVYYFIKNV